MRRRGDVLEFTLSALFVLILPVTVIDALAQEHVVTGTRMVETHEPAALPEPLTLEYALSLADELHPDILLAQSEQELARAEQSQVSAQSGVNVSLRGRLSWVEPSSVAVSRQHDDHHAGLFVSKRLYDFGRTAALAAAAEADVESRDILYERVRNQQRLRVMEAYFNVLLADLEFTRDNEAMAVAYVVLDRLRDRHELGMVSDIELARQESEYQQSRSVRYTSEISQRATRARLALVLNRPGKLSSTLQNPVLLDNQHQRGELEPLEQRILENNPELLALRKQLESAQELLQAARAGGNPVITGELEASEYSRDMGSRDELRAGIQFEMPLYKGGAVQAETAQRRAQQLRAQALLADKEMAVRQLVLELWQQVYVLSAQREEARALMDYRDLYLDRSRGLYELDVRTDLGDAMVRFSEARLQQAKTEYALALVWAQLDVLAGEEVFVPGTIIKVTDEQVGAQSGAGE